MWSTGPDFVILRARLRGELFLERGLIVLLFVVHQRSYGHTVS